MSWVHYLVTHLGPHGRIRDVLGSPMRCNRGLNLSIWCLGSSKSQTHQIERSGKRLLADPGLRSDLSSSTLCLLHGVLAHSVSVNSSLTSRWMPGLSWSRTGGFSTTLPMLSDIHYTAACEAAHLHLMLHSGGSFLSFTLSQRTMCCRLPSSRSGSQLASSLGVACPTTSRGLYLRLMYSRCLLHFRPPKQGALSSSFVVSATNCC